MTYCNPVNLDYRFQAEGWAKECLREAADPSVVRYGGEYWLFASKSGGYWHSRDMKNWDFTASRALPVEDYAPDVSVIDGSVFCTASRLDRPCPIFRSRNPRGDEWERVSEPLPFWDPALFQDDDRRVYLYWGCSSREPIYGVEMDRETMRPLGERLPLIAADPGNHGWERSGEDNTSSKAPWIEGAWMTKAGGVYYLQYAGPGTEFNIYADGVYTSNSPLGPFEYAAHNPFSLKPRGFIKGAGHGSTFADDYGNLWHVSTMIICVKHKFERRVGLFPAGIDRDGLMFCNTAFGDWPVRLADKRWDSMTDPFAGMMLLSYGAGTAASSCLECHAPSLAVDEDIRTYWAADPGDAEPELEIDLGDTCEVRAVQVNFAEHACLQYERNGVGLAHRYRLSASAEGAGWNTVCDKSENRFDVPHDYVELEPAVKARRLRLSILHMPGKGSAAVSGLRVFGTAPGKAPPAVREVSARRDPADERNAFVRWRENREATGYHVFWGIAPDKLYNSVIVYGENENEVEIRSLNRGTDYYCAVEPFNRSGRGELTAVRPAART
ncbi:MAG: family 43 glycosylhydrolase [Kiritimatiellia bacterium]